MNKRISILMTIVLLLSIMTPIHFFETEVESAGEIMYWVENDTMDSNLNIIENKAGEDDILLYGELDDNGDYILQYYLEDGQRTTVTFSHRFDEIELNYMIEELQTTTSGAVTAVNITQQEVDQAYLEMNYELEVPDWQFIEDKELSDADTLQFTIEESAGILYPGVAFEVNNRRVIFKWDFQSDVLYYQIVGYVAGNIMPVTYTNPSLETTEIDILKSIEGFQVVPTHIRINEAGTANEDVDFLEHPGDDKPGSRPGVKVIFNQPKTLDTNDWTYKAEDTNMSGLTAVMDFQDIADSDYLDFTFNLMDSTDPSSVSRLFDGLPDEDGINSGVVFDYDTDLHQYSFNIVQDKTGLLPGSETKFIQWDDLEPSSIYNVGLFIQIEFGNPQFDNYEFTGYLPEDNFAYTYMEYELRRANMTEAYLDITPYNVGEDDEIQYDILYSKEKKSPLHPDNDLWVQHFHEGSVESGTNIFIPVPFNASSSQDVYQIIINFASIDMASQVLNYKAEEDLNVPPTTPAIDYITNLFVIPGDSGDDSLSTIQFDLAWEAPDNRDSAELDTIFANEDNDESNDHIYYELMVNEVPEDTIGNPFKVIKVIDVHLESGEIVVDLHDLAPGNAVASNKLNFEDGYDSVDQLFRMDGITIYEADEWTEVINTVAEETTDTYDIIGLGAPYDFEYPGVNYLRMRAITEIDGKIGISYNSVPVSLSLSMLEYEIPIVEAQSYDPINGEEKGDPVGIDFSWHTVATDSYEVHMLTPVGKEIQNVIYDVYISQSQSAILSIDPENETYDTLTLDPDDNVFLDETDPDDYADLEDLRNNEVKLFSFSTNKNLNTTLNTEITGLDENTNYYFRIVTRLDIEDDAGVPSEKMSDPSNVLSVTTPIIPSDPDEGEVKPLSVENLVADYADENFISATLDWDYPEEIVFAEDLYGFEILSIEDTVLPEELSGRDIRLEDIYDSPLLANNNKEIWRLTIEDGAINLLKYDEETDQYELLDATHVVMGDQHLQVLDATNTPNKVYYYYVRTINTYQGTVNAASSWRYDTLTTSPVQAPINLLAVYDSQYSFDDKTQSIIRFDAPIPADADLVNDYIMEIHVKGEEDADYSMTAYPSEYLGQSEDGELGYVRMYYRIDGLDTGSSYSIKVRIEDRTKAQDQLPDGSYSYSKSPFSERIIIRTEFDQNEYEKEFVYNEYLDHFRDKAERLMQEDYFIIDVDDNDAVIKYRQEYGTGTLIQSHDSSYELIVPDLEEEQKTYTYYLPSSFFETVNDYNVIVSIRPNEHEIGLRPYSVGETVTTAIKEALADIRSYDSDMVDYYVKLVVSAGPYNNLVNEKEPVSDVLSISASVHGSTEKEIYIDTYMVDAFEALIEAHTEDLKDKLIEELEQGIDESKLLSVIEAEVDLIETDFYSKGQQELYSYLLDDYRKIDNSNKNLYIQLSSYGEPMDQEAYYRNGGIWQTVESMYYANAYLIENKSFTSYILAGRDSSSSELSGYFTSEEISVINRYNLTDIFTVDELTRKNQPVLKYQVDSAMARMLNASLGYDDATFLENKGIDVIKGNDFDYINREDSLYIYTQVFANRHQINLDTTYIHDYNMIDDVDDIKADYREVLLKGANLGLFQLDYGRVLPKEDTTVEDLIDLLTQIDRGLY